MIFKVFTGILLTTFLLSCSNDTKIYDSIINEIKKQNLPLEKLVRYQIEDFSKTSTIKKLPDNFTADRGKGKGCIWVFKTKENLLVFIETDDHEHAGEYGVVYSEKGQTPIWDNHEWGERWSIDKKIKDKWWNISFRLE